MKKGIIIDALYCTDGVWRVPDLDYDPAKYPDNVDALRWGISAEFEKVLNEKEIDLKVFNRFMQAVYKTST